MPRSLPSDILLDISQFLDARSVVRFSQAHRPMHETLQSDHGGRERFKIEAEKLGMEIGPIPRPLQKASSATLINMLRRYCYNLTHLMYQQREIIPLRNSAPTTEWSNDHAPTREQPYFNVNNYAGESSGCLYHVCHRPQLDKAFLEIFQFASVRKGLRSRLWQLEVGSCVLGVAIDALQNVVVLLTRQPGVEDLFALQFYHLNNETVFRQPFYLKIGWPSNVKVLQFEICGNHIAISVARWSRYSWEQLRFPLQLINWRSDVILPFIREDCLALLDWRVHNRELKVAVEILSFGDNPMSELITVDSIVPLKVPLQRNQVQALLGVSFLRNVAMPPKANPEFEEMCEFIVPEVFSKDALPETTNSNGPFHANPISTLVGVKVEFNPQESRSPDLVWLWERRVFYGSRERTPEMYQNLTSKPVLGYFHTLNGRRLTWYMDGIVTRDFDPLACRRYLSNPSGVDLSSSQCCTIMQPVVTPRPHGAGNEWIGDSSVECRLKQVTPRPWWMFGTEDNLVMITHGRNVGRTEELVAVVYTF
ncbi:hypothetical protein VKT23_012796 [Stygiomarasmius scandens]|uniref:F-box domain-containing protein n=1 Tax=Marasmiellus scandens TaxID=2682957 RepID=A0ABR1J7V6_9AGAR